MVAYYSVLFLFGSTAKQLPIFFLLYAMKEEMTIGRYVALLLTGLSPKSFFVAGFIEHMGVFYATTIGLLAFVTTPAPYVSCIGQAACRDFDNGNAMGLALHNPKAPAVPVVRYGCVVAQENPHALLLQVATSLSFLFSAVMLFAGFLWRFFGSVRIVNR